MTKDEVMFLANETAGKCWMDEAHLQRFAKALMLKERKDCAKLLDEMKACAEELMEHPDYSSRFEYERMLAFEDAAEAIRNRGKEVK